MRRFTNYLILILVLVSVSSSPAFPSSFFIYDQYGGTWQDANKTYQDDSLMCWAATASNILAYEGWGTSQYNTATSIFQDYVTHWTNYSGNMSWGWQWWFNGTVPMYGSKPDVPGEGNYYPTMNFNDYYTYAQGGNLLPTIDLLLHQGKGVGLVIRGDNGSHAVTVWGYSYSSPRNYTSIFITDSDDGYYGLQEYPLIWQNDTWYLGGGYSGWHLVNIQALGYNPSASGASMFLEGQTSGNDTVPIAPSWLLFGSGVFSLFILRRHGRRLDKQDS